MNKQKVMRQLEETWAALHESYAGLAEARLLEPGVTGDWSVKDILAHVTTWEEETLQHLPAILEGRRLPRYKDLYGGIDAFNAQMTEQKRSLSLAEVLAQAEETHRRLLAYVEAAPDEEFARETRFRRRLRLDTYSHYPIHTKAIREWRDRQSNT